MLLFFCRIRQFQQSNVGNSTKFIFLLYRFLTKPIFGIITKLQENLHLFEERELYGKQYQNEKGTCYGLIDHIGILCDGTIVPCCLDTKGIINLGNIFTNELNEILNSERTKNIINGFKNNYKCEKLCQKCNFINK